MERSKGTRLRCRRRRGGGGEHLFLRSVSVSREKTSLSTESFHILWVGNLDWGKNMFLDENAKKLEIDCFGHYLRGNIFFDSQLPKLPTGKINDAWFKSTVSLPLCRSSSLPTKFDACNTVAAKKLEEANEIGPRFSWSLSLPLQSICTG